jgi:GcrA cell cycle regulator
MVWDEDTIRILRELWSQGLSTAEIGRRLGTSKNAIVGKAHRLELDGRPSPIRRDGAKVAAERASVFPRMAGPTLPPLASATAPAMTVAAALSNIQPLRATPPPGLRPAPSPLPVSLRPVMQPAPVQTRRSAPSCCWPIGEPGTKEFRFCDDLSVAGKPYCDEHARVAYVRIRDRKEDAA